MHARLIQVTTKPGHLKDCIKSLVEQGIPILKQQPGFVDVVGLTSDTERDQFVGLTIWKSKEDAEKYANGQARQVLDSIKPFLQQEPTFRTFNLEASTIHNVGIGRAASSRQG
jgi:heme-degrading monooxygenase HmoA